MASPGISGFRNSYLKVLTREYADPRAAEVVTLLEDFAGQYINAELPSWFYVAFSGIRLVAPIKPSD
eukprot:11017228-Karenia_brevis.AAC.1